MTDIFNLPPPDHAEQVRQQAVALANFNKEFIDNIKQNHKLAFDFVWHNPIATPQEILTVFGNKAYLLFVHSGKIQQLLSEIDETYEALVPPKTYTINEDGTVTIAD